MTTSPSDTKGGQPDTDAGSGTVIGKLIVEGAFNTTNDAVWNGIATNIHGSWGGTTNYSENTNIVPAAAAVWDTDATATNRFLRLRVTRP